MPSTNSRHRAMNLDSNAKSIGDEPQIANNSNRQKRPKRIPKPMFKIWKIN